MFVRSYGCSSFSPWQAEAGFYMLSRKRGISVGKCPKTGCAAGLTRHQMGVIKRDTQCWWLSPVIPATWEAEIGRIKVPGQLRRIVGETPSPK
jgi:hypothetical protein